ncbi:MAG TPA: hypothetical protein VNW29_04765 [Candidatus Sulfotelmatobacter sp.]|jgi:hypothetical protein|nr:hypothetical protein [Candidatus Sulfotelmatobacter sp.]
MGINTGALYIIFIIITIVGFAYIISGPTPSQTPLLLGPEATINKNTTSKAHAMLQLYNFTGATITPPVVSLCKKGGANIHPEALIAYSPAQATAVSTNGQISLWVSDTHPPYIAAGEQVARGSGAVKTPGDRAARAPDNYIIEPQLYIFPQTVETNVRPYFPDFVKGYFNNGTLLASYNSDVIPLNALPTNGYTVEFVWNVKTIGLTEGEYQIEFVAHDGNQRLGIRCMSLRVYTPSATNTRQNKIPL